jgi:oligoribonuclease
MTTTPSTPDRDRLVAWIDTETTGLDERRGAVLEVGIVVTDMALIEKARRAWTVRFVGEVDDAIARMHGPDGSGLLRRIGGIEQGYRADIWQGDGLPVDEVDAMAAAWLADQCQGVAPLWGGRNVAFDRRWCRRHMPRLHEAVHHRSIDETTLRIALDAWAGLVVPKDATPQGNRHRALDDLDECLRVARAFRARMAPPPQDPPGMQWCDICHARAVKGDPTWCVGRCPDGWPSVRCPTCREDAP